MEILAGMLDRKNAQVIVGGIYWRRIVALLSSDAISLIPDGVYIPIPPPAFLS